MSYSLHLLKTKSVLGISMYIVITILTGNIIATDITLLAEAATGTVKFRDAPAVISGQNVYIAWWTNNTANNNEEVMFRASDDGGVSFGEKINLSNTTDSDSWRVDIAADGENVLVTWWETNQTDDIPVARISNDAGITFGSIIMLGQNGTIGNVEGEDELETEATTDTD